MRRLLHDSNATTAGGVALRLRPEPSLPGLQVMTASLPRFVSDFGKLANEWSSRGGEVRLHAPAPENAMGAWWIDPEVIARARSRLADDIEIRSLPLRRHRPALGGPIRCFRWASALAGRHPDDVFLFWTIPVAILLGLPFRALGRRCVFLITGLGSAFSSHSLGARAYGRLAAPVLGHLLRGEHSRTITHNHEDKEFLVRRLGVRPDRIAVTGGCGVDPEEYPYEELPAPRPRPVVLVPVRLLEEKGVREAARASGLLRARGVDHEMWFSSTPDVGNPHTLMMKDIERLEAEYDRVRFIGHQRHMAPVYRACDIVCVPTWYREGLPTALLEAAASGRPIVTTDNVGGREFTRDGRNGFLVPARDPVALADAIGKLVADRSLRETFRRNAHRDFLAGYTKDHMLRRTLSLLATLGPDLAGLQDPVHAREGHGRWI